MSCQTTARQFQNNFYFSLKTEICYIELFVCRTDEEQLHLWIHGDPRKVKSAEEEMMSAFTL